MNSKERFRFELLKMMIFFRNDHSLSYDEMVNVLKDMAIDAEAAMASGQDWFDKWLERQAS